LTASKKRFKSLYKQQRRKGWLQTVSSALCRPPDWMSQKWSSKPAVARQNAFWGSGKIKILKTRGGGLEYIKQNFDLKRRLREKTPKGQKRKWEGKKKAGKI